MQFKTCLVCLKNTSVVYLKVRIFVFATNIWSELATSLFMSPIFERCLDSNLSNLLQQAGALPT
jgi:hypothetical protein